MTDSTESKRRSYSAYYQRNREAKIAKAREWARQNPEKKRAAELAYKAQNREKYLFYRAKRSAKDRGLEFSIEVSDIVVPDVCPVFGVPLEWNTEYAPSLDRIYNDIGYVKGNIVVVSWRANRLKRAATMAEIQALAAFYARYDW